MTPSQPDDTLADRDRVLIRNLVLDFSIGIYEHEQAAPQKVRFCVEIDVVPRGDRTADEIGEVLSYEAIVNEIKALAAGPHINLVETLAERVAEICLRRPRALRVLVRVEKLEIEPCAEAVGVEIVRTQPRPTSADKR